MKSLVVVCCFILFDVITGVLKAIKTGTINSTIAKHGLLSKATEILCVVGGILLEMALPYLQITVDLPLAPAISTYISVMELISIIENMCEVNSSLSALFKPYLDKLKGKDGDAKGD